MANYHQVSVRVIPKGSDKSAYLKLNLRFIDIFDDLSDTSLFVFVVYNFSDDRLVSELAEFRQFLLEGPKRCQVLKLLVFRKDSPFEST
jgi:hypothetical protein